MPLGHASQGYDRRKQNGGEATSASSPPTACFHSLYAYMIKKEEVYKIGQFNKPHGIHGELLFTFTDDIFDRVEAEFVICNMDGILVPFFIEEYRFRSDTSAIMKLEGVETSEQARRFTGIEVFFPVKHADRTPDEELTWDYFRGFRMEEIHHGTLGEIIHVDTSTINTLFIVNHNGEELLIPAQDSFIVDIDRQHRVITTDLPEGLLSLDTAETE